MRSKAISLCALLLTSMIFVVSAPVESEEEFPELPPMPFTESPSFESYGVTPQTGWNDTTFSFYLNASLDYFWNETIPQLAETVRVYVDNEPYAMHENNTRDTNWTDGKDFYWMNENRLWAKGFHNYFFYVEVNESSNMTGTQSFEIYNRAPYLLTGPFSKIYTTQEFEFEFRATDEDLDPLNWTLTTNMTIDDYTEFEFVQNNTTSKVKIKCDNGPWIRWLKIVVHDPYDNEAYWRWEVYCLENEIPGRNPSVPRNIGGGSDFTRGVGDSQITPNDGPFHNTDYYWCGSDCGGNGFAWDDENNWREGAGWTITGYPIDADDRAYLNETSDDLYLLDGANSVITLGELHTASGFSGTITFSIDLILDRSLGKSGDLDHAAGTIDVNTSNEQINLDGNPTISATFNEQEGIIIVQGAQTQEIRVQSPNKLYKLTTDTASTVGELYDNLTAYQITIGASTTFKADANTRGYELWTNFSDVAGCGFVSTSSGTLNLIGASSGRGANITTADATPPPTNRWTMGDLASGWGVQAENATFSYGSNLLFGRYNNNIIVRNVSILNVAGSYAFRIWGITTNMDDTIQNVNISSSSSTNAMWLNSMYAYDLTIDNITVYGFTGVRHMTYNYASTGRLEFLDSSFDETNILLTGSAHLNAWISHDHNDVANAYKLGCQSGYTLSKSTITNDWGTGDNIEIISGTHILDENGEAETIKIDSGATLQVGKTVPDAAITLTFDDSVGAGFDATTLGTLVGSGSSSYQMTITSAGSPPANCWGGLMAGGSVQTLTYTTISYGCFFGIRSASSVLTHVTIDNMAHTGSLRYWFTTTSDDDVVITNPTLSDIRVYNAGVKPELTNSNFNINNVGLPTGQALISTNHNDISNAYKIVATTLSKSSITNDYASLSDVQLISGTFTIDIASASNDFTIDSGATLVLNTANTHTFDADANLTNAGIFKSDGTITTSSGYFDFYNTGSIWLNNSTVSNADLNYYLGGFNFSVGKAANSTIDDWNLVADSGADVSFNITSYDFNNKNSGIIWHMNTTATTSENIRFHTKNLTSGEYYWLYVDNSFHEYEIADANGWANYSINSWSTKYIYLTWASGPQVGGRPGGGVITGIGATFQYIIISDDTVEFRANILGFSEGRDMTITYYWVFSDNTTSNEKNPTKSFEYTGITANASATLTVCNEKSCSQPIEKSVHLIRWWIIALILAAIITPVIIGAWQVDRKFR